MHPRRPASQSVAIANNISLWASALELVRYIMVEPGTAARMEHTRMANLEASWNSGSLKAAFVMNRDIVKPMPAKIPALTN
jgi:hypothetical protein